MNLIQITKTHLRKFTMLCVSLISPQQKTELQENKKIGKFEKNNKTMRYNSITVANYFIKKYAETGNITPLKLLKLVYIAHGWYLALNENEKQLITEKPQAWQYGPVLPELYKNIKHFGKGVITEPINKEILYETISDEDAKFLDKIWEVYGPKDGLFLSALTHQEGTPWSETYPKGYNIEIPNDLIFKHYKNSINKKETT